MSSEKMDSIVFASVDANSARLLQRNRENGSSVFCFACGRGTLPTAAKYPKRRWGWARTISSCYPPHPQTPVDGGTLEKRCGATNSAREQTWAEILSPPAAALRRKNWHYGASFNVRLLRTGPWSVRNGTHQRRGIPRRDIAESGAKVICRT